MRFNKWGLVAMMLCTTLVGCNSAQSNPQKEMPFNIEKLVIDLDKIELPQDMKIVGVGEASHGVSEYHQLKGQIFKNLVIHHQAKLFVIEGDFGGSLKVDEYIHGGNGTAMEALSEIGFAIYNTQELVDVVEWMRAYNETVPEEESLHFYGMDMQRFDNSKEYLFNHLDEIMPEISTEYKALLNDCNDENRLDLTQEQLVAYEQILSDLISVLKDKGQVIVDGFGPEKSDLLLECANSLQQYVTLLMADDYNTVRDGLMKEKVDWFASHNKTGTIMIHGHNGHISKSSLSGYLCLGEQLKMTYGDAYFAIGTDALKTTFNSQTDEGFEVLSFENQTPLTQVLHQLETTAYYLDLHQVEDEEAWNALLTNKIAMSAVNISVAKTQLSSKLYTTLQVIPNLAYDGLVIYESVNPTTILK